jgi:hypothetical protein
VTSKYGNQLLGDYWSTSIVYGAETGRTSSWNYPWTTVEGSIGALGQEWPKKYLYYMSRESLHGVSYGFSQDMPYGSPQDTLYAFLPGAPYGTAELPFLSEWRYDGRAFKNIPCPYFSPRLLGLLIKADASRPWEGDAWKLHTDDSLDEAWKPGAIALLTVPGEAGKQPRTALLSITSRSRFFPLVAGLSLDPPRELG